MCVCAYVYCVSSGIECRGASKLALHRRLARVELAVKKKLETTFQVHSSIEEALYSSISWLWTCGMVTGMDNIMGMGIIEHAGHGRYGHGLSVGMEYGRGFGHIYRHDDAGRRMYGRLHEHGHLPCLSNAFLVLHRHSENLWTNYSGPVVLSAWRR